MGNVLRRFASVPTPKAPSIGLFLDETVFNNYNKKFGSKNDKNTTGEAHAHLDLESVRVRKDPLHSRPF